MKRKEYTEEQKGAKERFDRAMAAIFRAPKTVAVPCEKASSRKKTQKSGKEKE